MNFTSFWLLSFIAVLCALPWLIKWVQRRTGRGLGAKENTTTLVSMLALGPAQRVMTIEVGPEHARTQLVLGVSAQSITCLHAMAVLPLMPQATPQTMPLTSTSTSVSTPSFAAELQELKGA